jgi:D-tyrosyl-tRNA(Tyr) deacylase
MRVLLQRVKYASVKVNNEIVGKCGEGLLLLVGFTNTDNESILEHIANRVVNLRIFEDENNKMNLSILDIKGSILSISQFTLYADARKGRRPSFTDAMKPDQAVILYKKFNEELRKYDIMVEEGIFGADMKVELLNDGPVTIMLDSLID